MVPSKGQAGDLLNIPERRLPGTKRDQEGALFVETLLQVDAIYGPSQRITLSDEQEAARMVSLDDQFNKDDGTVMVVMRIDMNLLKKWHGTTIN